MLVRLVKNQGRVFLTLLAVFAANHVQAQVVTHGSFETPDIPTNTFVYQAAGGAWTFEGTSGIIDPPSGFNAPAGTDGPQVGFIQLHPTDPIHFGTFSQSITLATTGSYTLSYQDAGRSDTWGDGDVEYEVLLDSTLIVDSVATTTGQPFTARHFEFVADAGSYTLTFRGDPAQPLSEDTAFFDQIVISPTPLFADGFESGNTANWSAVTP